jgi:hypothetical protein
LFANIDIEHSGMKNIKINVKLLLTEFICGVHIILTTVIFISTTDFAVAIQFLSLKVIRDF